MPLGIPPQVLVELSFPSVNQNNFTLCVQSDPDSKSAVVNDRVMTGRQ